MPSSQRSQDAGDLLLLAMARPQRAQEVADELISSTTDPWVLSVARQARGLILRDSDQLGLAVPELRTALRLALRSGDPDRVADVRATLGAALVMAGLTSAGLVQLDRAVSGAVDPAVLAKVLMRRGHGLMLIGRYREALVDVRKALADVRLAGDRVWEARTLNNLSIIHLRLGQVEAAGAAAREAEALYLSEGQELEAVMALENRGFIAYCTGDLPTTFTLYDAAASGYAALGIEPAELALDQCVAFLAAGLVQDAVDIVTAQLSRDSLHAIQRAELLLMLATAQLSGGHSMASLASARAARRLFQRQRRDWWALRAELAVLRARHQGGAGGRSLVESAAEVGRKLEAARSDDAPIAWLLAGRIAASMGLESGHELLAAAARYRRHQSDLMRATGWLARALDQDANGNVRGVFAACRQGLDALDDHRMTLGSSELRALSTFHGNELASLALRHAVTTRPRTLLAWSERWRATALSQPPVRPPDDAELAESLAALRDNNRRLDEARATNGATTAMEQDRSRLEQSIRRRRHRLAGAAAAASPFRVDRLVAEVGDTSFLELVDVGGRLHAVVVTEGRVRKFRLGTAGEAGNAVDFARFALRQAARGRPSSLGHVGSQLQAALLGDAARALSTGPVVISPTSPLHATPWALLPALADVPVSVVPSAALWLRARSTQKPDGARVLIAGPGLSTGGSELAEIGRLHPEAVVLRDGTATVENSLRALDGAALAHIAAHGMFRPDSPMFSAMELDDGPLTVHDFERLNRAPHRLVLSACDSGVMAPVGAGELLGLASALLSMGTAGIVSSVALVNDEATAAMMINVHQGLDEIDDLAQVMLQARVLARGDSVHEATAAAFLALGV